MFDAVVKQQIYFKELLPLARLSLFGGGKFFKTRFGLFEFFIRQFITCQLISKIRIVTGEVHQSVPAVIKEDHFIFAFIL